MHEAELGTSAFMQRTPWQQELPRTRQKYGPHLLSGFNLSSAATVHRSTVRTARTTTFTMTGKGAKGLSGKGAKGTMGDKKGDKKKPISRSARAGLQFPVGRIHRLLKVRPLQP
jgi:hypothetical protein